jgi:hypothetical protein
MQQYTAALEDSANSYSELFPTGSTFIQFLVCKLVRFDIATVRTYTSFVIFTPALDFQKSNAYFIVWELLLNGEDVVHIYSLYLCYGFVRYISTYK